MKSAILKVAALSCSYNRLEKTSTFLKSLTTQHIPEQYKLDIYLLDDQSPDGTADYVREQFPAVKVIEGSGSLFWAGGMRMLWRHVINQGDYDFFILLNDDVTLLDNAISRLLESYHQSKDKLNILIGTVQNFDLSKITYGGHVLLNRRNGLSKTVKPNEVDLMVCDLGNANIMMVDKGTVNKIGVLSDRYIHSFADWDYTLTAIKHGIKVWVAPGYYGYCEYDHGNPWLSAGHTFKERLAYMYSPKGLEYRSCLRYVRKHFPLNYLSSFSKLWLKTLLPVVYDRFKKE